MTFRTQFKLKRQALPAALLIASTSLPALLSAQGRLEVRNPGFEQGMKEWAGPPKALHKAVSITDEQAHSGSKSLKLDSTGEIPSGAGVMLFQTVSNLKPNSIYHLSAWAKGGKGGRGSIRAAIKLEYYNSDGENTTGVNSYHSLMQDGEWDRIQVVARTEEDTTRVKVYARNLDPGSVIYFDDFEISQPELLTLEPTRLMHVPGKETPVTVRVSTGEGLPEGATVDLLASHNGEEKRYAGKIEDLGEGIYAVTAVLPAIEKGHYVITPAIGDDRSPVTARTFSSIEQRRPENLSETGTILKNGKPFFPIGIYHPQNFSYYRPEAERAGVSNDVEGVKEDYRKIAESGFNAVQGASTGNVEMFGLYLDEAHKNGLVVDVPFYGGGRVKKNLANSLEKIRRFKDHPAVLNWKISDEPDMRPSIVDEVPEAYLAFKQADSKTPVEVTLATDHALDSWSNFMDIIQINRYPLPGAALTRVSDYTRLAVKNKQPWQNVSYVLQSGWTKEGTEPTVHEMRSMVYLALIEGAKGIWYYTMYDPNFDLTTRAIWPHMKGVNAEIKKLSEPVMIGTLEPNATLDNAKVYSRALEHEGKLYVLLTNPERSAQKTTMTVPAKWENASVQTLTGEEVKVQTPGRIELEFDAVDSRTLIFETTKKD